MGFMSTMIGASLGFGLQIYSNAVRRIPLARGAHPSPPPDEKKTSVPLAHSSPSSSRAILACRLRARWGIHRHQLPGLGIEDA